jgi:hypothetical protein
LTCFNGRMFGLKEETLVHKREDLEGPLNFILHSNDLQKSVKTSPFRRISSH